MRHFVGQFVSLNKIITHSFKKISTFSEKILTLISYVAMRILSPTLHIHGSKINGLSAAATLMGLTHIPLNYAFLRATDFTNP